MENTFVNTLSDAMAKYVAANDLKLPDNVSQLKPFFDPPVDEAMLDRYKLLYTGKLRDVPPGKWILTESALVDEEYDTRWGIGAGGFGILPPSQTVAATLLNELAPAIRAFTDAKNGTPPDSLAQLKPFLQTPAQQEAAERLDRMGGYLDRNNRPKAR